MSDLSAPQFTKETAAIAHLEASRWPDGVNCPHCGSVNVRRMGGETQAGYFLCNDCRDKFTCRTGTVMERSHIPVHKWLLAIHLLTASKKGMSAHQLHRMLGITYKSAWFLAHRIREAMDTPKPEGMGGEGEQVQADETYYGNTSKRAKYYKKGHSQKSGVVALVNPKSGEARAFVVKPATSATVNKILWTNVHRSTAARLWSNLKGLEQNDFPPFLKDCLAIRQDLSSLLSLLKERPSTLPDKFQQPIIHRNEAVLRPRRTAKAPQRQRPPSKPKLSAAQKRARALKNARAKAKP